LLSAPNEAAGSANGFRNAASGSICGFLNPPSGFGHGFLNPPSGRAAVALPGVKRMNGISGLLSRLIAEHCVPLGIER
jgi:hypothetical protein